MLYTYTRWDIHIYPFNFPLDLSTAYSIRDSTEYITHDSPFDFSSFSFCIYFFFRRSKMQWGEKFREIPISQRERRDSGNNQMEFTDRSGDDRSRDGHEFDTTAYRLDLFGHPHVFILTFFSNIIFFKRRIKKKFCTFDKHFSPIHFSDFLFAPILHFFCTICFILKKKKM